MGVFKVNTSRGTSADQRLVKTKPWYVKVQVSRSGYDVKAVHKSFATEREAAIHADRVNLEYNLGKPLNILKPKTA